MSKTGQSGTDLSLQKGNRLWWNRNPMSYDWHGTLPFPEGSKEFFEEIDARFFGSSPFYQGAVPFERLIPFDSLKGKSVLEIGCGLGSHAQLLSQAGGVLSAIDLTPRAVELTRKRLSLNGLKADVTRMDAEKLSFADETFNFIWSWGVIHHSAHPESILKEAHRVLKPFGEFRLMVYHRRSLSAAINLLRGILSGKIFRGMSPAEILSHYSDGYVARFYTAGQLSRMLLDSGFEIRSIGPLGQKLELIPLPGKGALGRLKSALLSLLPDWIAGKLLRQAGSFLFCVAVKPGRGDCAGS